MQQFEIINILKKTLNFSDHSIEKLKKFTNLVLKENQNYNLIAKSTEKQIWHRHILDSAQLVKFIDFNVSSMADLGTGAGFPGLVVEIFNKNRAFHVKLYEKSPVKRAFLEKVSKKLSIKVQIFGNIYDEVIDSNYIVSRAFKKIEAIIQVSREIAKKSHKIIILKGQNAQKDLKKAFKKEKYDYKLEKSITDESSKIIIVDFKK